MGKQARINAARKAAGLPVDDNGYHEKRLVRVHYPRAGKSVIPALISAAQAMGGVNKTRGGK